MKNADRRGHVDAGAAKRSARKCLAKTVTKADAEGVSLLVPVFLEDEGGAFHSTEDLVAACHADEELLRLAASVIARRCTAPALGKIDIGDRAVAMRMAPKRTHWLAAALRNKLDVPLIDSAVRVLAICVALFDSPSRPHTSVAQKRLSSGGAR